MNTDRSLISEAIAQKRYNERYILSRDERERHFEILEHIRLTEGLDRYEYRYLTFLIWKYGFDSSASLPGVPNIVDITLDAFEQRFAFNPERKNIYEIFKAGLKRCIELYGLKEIVVLIGGSYTNQQNQFPNDIDPLILLPKEQWNNDRKHPILNQVIREFKSADTGKKVFDLHKILADISEEHYMFYELMTLMGNTPESKMNSGIRNMKFECKDLLRLRLAIKDI